MHNLEFEIMCRNMNELHEGIRELKHEFSDIIASYETNLYYDEGIVQYLPSQE
jgi:hypothetical protein